MAKSREVLALLRGTHLVSSAALGPSGQRRTAPFGGAWGGDVAPKLWPPQLALVFRIERSLKVKSFEKQFYSVEDVVHMTGLSRQTIYNLIHTGKLPSLQIGKKYFFPVSLFDQYNTSLSLAVSVFPTT